MTTTTDAAAAAASAASGAMAGKALPAVSVGGGIVATLEGVITGNPWIGVAGVLIGAATLLLNAYMARRRLAFDQADQRRKEAAEAREAELLEMRRKEHLAKLAALRGGDMNHPTEPGLL